MSRRHKNYEVLPALSVRGAELRSSLRIVTIGWMFGSVWMISIGGATMLNLGYLAGFTELHWGVLAATMYASTLAQLPASWLIERTGLRKSQFMRAATVSRAMWIVVGLAPVLLLWLPAEQSIRTTVAWSVLGVILLSRVLDSVGVPAWINWMADLIPSRIRGRMFAKRAFYSLICQVAATVSIGLILDAVISTDMRTELKQLRVGAAELPSLVWVLLAIFTFAGIVGVIDIRLFGRVREIVRKRPPAPIGLWQVLREPLCDRQFIHFAGSFATMAFGTAMSMPFFALACQRYLDFNNLQTMVILAVCPPVGSLLSSNLWGGYIDRHGRRPVLILNMIGTGLVVWCWVFLPPGRPLLAMLAMIMAGVVWQGLLMARLNMELSIADEKGRSTYSAALNVLTAFTGTLGGLAGGLIAGAVRGWTLHAGPLQFGHYHVMFALCGVFRIFGVLWLLRMEDPGAKPVSVLARQVAASVLYSAPVNLVRPIRRIGRPSGWLRRSRRWNRKQ